MPVDVASAASGDGYSEVLESISDTLLDSLTDDWRKLRNALWLVEHLLSCTPQLMCAPLPKFKYRTRHTDSCITLPCMSVTGLLCTLIIKAISSFTLMSSSLLHLFDCLLHIRQIRRPKQCMTCGRHHPPAQGRPVRGAGHAARAAGLLGGG